MAGIALHTPRTKDRIALRGVRITSRLAGMAQRTTVEQTFINLEKNAIEAVYTFPLPENAAVCAFEVITADRILTGAIEEDHVAAEKYDQAIARGDAAFMVEQNRPDIFTVRVGNLKPHQAATIRLTYVCPLELADRAIRIAFPTTIAPRYITDSGVNDPVRTLVDGEAINPPHVLSVPYGLSLEMDIALARPVKAIDSPSHAIEVARVDQATQRITFAGGVVDMDRDVVISIALADEDAPAIEAERGPDGAAYLAVSFLPSFPQSELIEPQPAETFFVIDCSGSMGGDSTAQAVAALQLCLRSLNPGDCFNICRFGSTYELMGPRPIAYDQAALERALAWVNREANLGGTELLAPLQAILDMPVRQGRVRQIVLLTDGQISNEEAVLALARKCRAHNRIFTFGIGSAASASLVRGLARATGGAAEFITEGERIDDKVLRAFARMASPPVADVHIDWDGAQVQTLAELPPVFDGDVLAVYGRVDGQLPGTITLSCATPLGPRQWKLPVPPAGGSGLIATLWARRSIQSLQEINDLHPLLPPEARQTPAAQQLIRLSRQFGLLSCLTTFIAIEHRSLEERNEGAPATRRVPVMLAKGWGGVDRVDLLCGGAAATNASVLAPSSYIDSYLCEVPTEPRPGLLARVRALLSSGGGAPAGPPEPVGLAHSLVHALLSLQSADGDFAWDVVVDHYLRSHGHQPNQVRQLAENDLAPSKPKRSALPRVVATLVVLAILRLEEGPDGRLSRRAARKAEAWLARTLGIAPAEARALADHVAKSFSP